MVLLANGTTKPIDQIKVGDTVADAAPDAPAGEIHTVARVIVTHDDHDFVDLSIAPLSPVVAGPRPAADLTTTAHHPFYDRTQAAFVDAAALRVGDIIQTQTGVAVVTGVRTFGGSGVTYDLTIDGLHTYFVVAGTTSVLVHNDSCPRFVRNQPLTDKQKATAGYRYQMHVTGSDTEQVWNNAGREIHVDGGPTSGGFITETKFVGNESQWTSSPYHPDNYFNEDSFVDQAGKLLGLNNGLGGNGVRYAVSSSAPAPTSSAASCKHTSPRKWRAVPWPCSTYRWTGCLDTESGCVG